MCLSSPELGGNHLAAEPIEYWDKPFILCVLLNRFFLYFDAAPAVGNVNNIWSFELGPLLIKFNLLYIAIWTRWIRFIGRLRLLRGILGQSDQLQQKMYTRQLFSDRMWHLVCIITFRYMNGRKHTIWRCWCYRAQFFLNLFLFVRSQCDCGILILAFWSWTEWRGKVEYRDGVRRL